MPKSDSADSHLTRIALRLDPAVAREALFIQRYNSVAPKRRQEWLRGVCKLGHRAVHTDTGEAAPVGLPGSGGEPEEITTIPLRLDARVESERPLIAMYKETVRSRRGEVFRQIMLTGLDILMSKADSPSVNLANPVQAATGACQPVDLGASQRASVVADSDGSHVSSVQAAGLQAGQGIPVASAAEGGPGIAVAQGNVSPPALLSGTVIPDPVDVMPATASVAESGSASGVSARALRGLF